MTITETPRLPESAGKFVPVQTRSERPASFEPEDFPKPAQLLEGILGGGAKVVGDPAVAHALLVEVHER